jgi:GIY-YIG catalytic domain-containing protein
MEVIYLLIDPRNNSPRYVGYTKDFATRIHYHYRPPRFQNKRKKESLTYPWLAELAGIGLLPVSKTLEEITDGVDWQERERFWIAYYRNISPHMLNVEDGGMGGKTFHKRATPQKRAKWRDAVSVGCKNKWDSRTPKERQILLENGAFKGLQKMRPKTRDWRGRYNGAMDIPTETLFDL